MSGRFLRTIRTIRQENGVGSTGRIASLGVFFIDIGPQWATLVHPKSGSIRFDRV